MYELKITENIKIKADTSGIDLLKNIRRRSDRLAKKLFRIW